MLAEPTVLALSLAYLGLLFAVAYFGDRYARDWSAQLGGAGRLWPVAGHLLHLVDLLRRGRPRRDHRASTSS